jgi:hypothetical protein
MSSSCVLEHQTGCSAARHFLEVSPWFQAYVGEGDETSSSVQTYQEECRTVGSAAEPAAEEDVSMTGATTNTRRSRRTLALPMPEENPAQWQSAVSPSHPTNLETATNVEVDGHTFIVYQQLRANRVRNLIIALSVALFVVLGMVILPAVLFGVVVVKKSR